MAGPYRCDFCETNQAALVIGSIETGEQHFACPPCGGRFGLDLAKKLLEPEEIAAQLGPMFIEGAAKQAAPPKRPRKRAEKAQETSEPPPRPETTPALEEEQAAAPDG